MKIVILGVQNYNVDLFVIGMTGKASVTFERVFYLSQMEGISTTKLKSIISE
jgi:hypothetical protein